MENKKKPPSALEEEDSSQFRFLSILKIWEAFLGGGGTIPLATAHGQFLAVALTETFFKFSQNQHGSSYSSHPVS